MSYHVLLTEAAEADVAAVRECVDPSRYDRLCVSFGKFATRWSVGFLRAELGPF